MKKVERDDVGLDLIELRFKVSFDEGQFFLILIIFIMPVWA